MLSMTPQWARAAKSVAKYVLLKKEARITRSKDALKEYNDWLHWSGLTIDDANLDLWLMSFAQDHIKTESAKALPTL